MIATFTILQLAADFLESYFTLYIMWWATDRGRVTPCGRPGAGEAVARRVGP